MFVCVCVMDKIKIATEYSFNHFISSMTAQTVMHHFLFRCDFYCYPLFLGSISQPTIREKLPITEALVVRLVSHGQMCYVISVCCEFETRVRVSERRKKQKRKATQTEPPKNTTSEKLLLPK